MKLGDLRKVLRAILPEPKCKRCGGVGRVYEDGDVVGATCPDCAPRSLAKTETGEAPARCPKCHAVSPCVHFDSVDVGIGTITGNHQYSCPVHGDFIFDRENGKAIFQEDELAPPWSAVDIHATITTPEQARSAKEIIDDIKRGMETIRGGGVDHLTHALEGVPEVAWASLIGPDGREVAPRTPLDRRLGTMGIIESLDPVTGTRLLPGTFTSVTVPPEHFHERCVPDIKIRADESVGVGEVFIVSPGGPVARMDISRAPASADSVTFAPVCETCGGSGKVQEDPTEDGWKALVHCDACGGTGSASAKP